MKTGFIDKVVGRLDKLDAERLQTVLTQLAREKGFYEAIFNSIQEGVVVLDSDGRVSYLNPAASELLGVSEAHAAGQSVAQLFPDVNWDAIVAVRPEERALSRELEIFHPRHRLLDFYLMPLDAEVGTTAQPLALILRDVTALRKAAAETIESQKLGALSLLAASVAHELGNPLNALSIHLQLLGRALKKLPVAKRKKLEESLTIAQDEIGRLDYIVSQFLQAIRPSQPKLRRESVNDLLGETIDFLTPEIANRGIIIERDFSASLPRILLDKAQIKQAFFNIIKNAAQAMSKGGRLRIATDWSRAPLRESDASASARGFSTSADHVIVTFADTGGGISPHTMRKITKPYATTKEAGTGLGLLIVRRIVRDHGGDLELESAAGRGTTVRLRLPLAEKHMRLLEAAK